MSVDAALREPPWRAGLRGARANLVPGFVLQPRLWPSFWPTTIMLRPGRPSNGSRPFARTRVFAFGIVSTGLFGGLLPFLYLRSNPAARHQYGWRQGLLLTAFWSYKGLEVEAWYRLLARVVGEGHDAQPS